MRKQYIAKFADFTAACQYSRQLRDKSDETHLVVRTDNTNKRRWEVWKAEEYWAYCYRDELTQKQCDELYELVSCYTVNSEDEENETYG